MIWESLKCVDQNINGVKCLKHYLKIENQITGARIFANYQVPMNTFKN